MSKQNKLLARKTGEKAAILALFLMGSGFFALQLTGSKPKPNPKSNVSNLETTPNPDPEENELDGCYHVYLVS